MSLDLTAEQVRILSLQNEVERLRTEQSSLLRSYREALARHYETGDYARLGMWVQDNQGALELALGGIPRA